MRRYRIAAIPGDGIGAEVIAAGVEALEACAGREGFALAFDHFDWGSDYFKRHGCMMPAASTLTCGPPASCPASSARCATCRAPSSTG
jgi:isocitrate/isopropylmalate dehydrogenase